MGTAAWVLVVLAGVLIAVALVVFVAPLARRADGGDSGRPRTSAAPSATGSLARGFSYLHVSSRSRARRGGVHERLARAFARIDAVDPHAAPRRVGEALAQGRRSEPTAARSSSTSTWSAGPGDQTGEVR